MTIEEIQGLKHGLYIIYWSAGNGGGSSLAAVGSDQAGKRWFAPTNWTSGSHPMGEVCEDIYAAVILLPSQY